MKNYRPLLLQELNLQLPGIKVHRLRLNRHLPEARLTEHEHAHDQILVYLMGKGRLRVDGALYQTRPGTVFLVPPGIRHSFEQQPGRHPLCLVIDLELEAGRGVAHLIDNLSAEQLNETRARISSLFRHPQVEKREMSLRVAAVVLDVLDMALKSVSWLAPVNRFSISRQFSISKRVERILESKFGADETLQKIAETTGYQRDHLNRLLRAECGLSLGQLRSRVRLKCAVAMLADRKSVRETGVALGITDPNYFARWFRQQTGVTPSSWRRNPRELRV